MQENEQRPERHVFGFVSIIGRPNVGKSTLLNALLETKLAIVADKPQTTRTAIQGVLTLPGAQIVFLDTPGVHQPATTLNQRMMDSVHAALEERDLLLLVADANVPPTRDDDEAIRLAQRAGTPTVLVLNKVDARRGKEHLLPRIEDYGKRHDFAEVVPISALTGDGLPILRSVLLARLPEGPAMFPADHLTDQPERFLVAELIREKIILETRQEVPHSVAVLIEEWEDTPNLTRISATIYVERDGQKAIIIGAKGAMLKVVGTAARTEIETLLDRKVFLELYVKVRPGWRENPYFLDELRRLSETFPEIG